MRQSVTVERVYKATAVKTKQGGNIQQGATNKRNRLSNKVERKKTSLTRVQGEHNMIHNTNKQSL